MATTPPSSKVIYISGPIAGYDCDKPQEPDAKPSDLLPAFKAAGIESKDDMLAYCANITQRELATANDLTSDEVIRIVDALHWDAQ